MFKLSLQFFGDGGEAQGVANDGGDTGFEITPRMAKLQKKYGIDFASISGQNEQSTDSQPATDEEAEVTKAESEEAEAPSKTPEEEFEELISGRFKDLYEKKASERAEKAVKDRFKKQDADNKKNSDYEKALSRLAYHYGKDKSDFAGIVESIEADDAWLEDEAFAKNMSTKALREQENTQRELNELRAQISQREAEEKKQETFARWTKESDETKELYPAFNPQTEFNDPNFLKALAYHQNVTAAYEATHFKEILAATAKAVEQRTTENLSKMYARGKTHPQESASNASATAQSTFDPSKLTHKELADLRERIARGEQPFNF